MGLCSNGLGDDGGPTMGSRISTSTIRSRATLDGESAAVAHTSGDKQRL